MKRSIVKIMITIVLGSLMILLPGCMKNQPKDQPQDQPGTHEEIEKDDPTSKPDQPGDQEQTHDYELPIDRL